MLVNIFDFKMQDWGGGEDCVHYKGKNGKWNDHKCSTEFKYICGPLPTPKGNQNLKTGLVLKLIGFQF